MQKNSKRKFHIKPSVEPANQAVMRHIVNGQQYLWLVFWFAEDVRQVALSAVLSVKM